MFKLIKAEFYKLYKLRSFHLIFLFALVVGILRGYSPYTGYQVYSIGLIPELLDAVLISVFTVAFVCTEFSARTFGNTFLCGAIRKNIFLAKLAAYFPGLFMLLLIPLATSTSVATLKNGFGADWETVAIDIGSQFLVYILHSFSMAGFSILVASVIQNSVGTLGLSVAGIYLVTLAQNPMENSAAQDMFFAYIINTVILLSAAVFIFIRQDIK